jgi:hypothetical protein
MWYLRHRCVSGSRADAPLQREHRRWTSTIWIQRVRTTPEILTEKFRTLQIAFAPRCYLADSGQLADIFSPERPTVRNNAISNWTFEFADAANATSNVMWLASAPVLAWLLVVGKRPGRQRGPLLKASGP